MREGVWEGLEVKGGGETEACFPEEEDEEEALILAGRRGPSQKKSDDA